MDLTEPEAAEIAAESVATIDTWAGTDAELFDATAPRAPATLRLIEATKHGEVPHSASRGVLGPRRNPQIMLGPTTCRSIALNLHELGFAEAELIDEALSRHDKALGRH
jgi:hypothetical protein